MKLFFVALFICFFSSNIKAQNAICNCCTENHSQFDFWIGTWEVTNPDGTLAGTNIINKVQNNCILQENWTSAKGNYTGTSNNFYNYKTKQWEQIWIDSQGQSLYLKGNKKDNQIIMQTAQEINKDGTPFFNRITWTHNEDGTVRQLWETITNNKDTTVAFDGLYKKIK